MNKINFKKEKSNYTNDNTYLRSNFLLRWNMKILYIYVKLRPMTNG